MRLLNGRGSLFFLVLLLFTPSRLAASAQSDSIFGSLPVFELHSSFWVNLHHTLYQEARQRGAAASTANPDASSPSSSGLNPSEQRAWDAAVAFYRANFANRDQLFNTELILITNQLGDFEDCAEIAGRTKKTCDAGLPADLTQVLDSAATVYRVHQWPVHDRANRRWINAVAPLVRERGVAISERLAEIYQTNWPKEKIRVDVAAYANSNGAYTTLDPLRITIASLDERNQGDEALEILFHEASHGIAQTVQNAIIRECHQRGKAIPRDLWHALIFYTTGEVIRPLLNVPKSSIDLPGQSNDPRLPIAPVLVPNVYTPYAIREGLYERGWEDYLKLLTRFWQPYLDNKSTYDDAIARMISSL